MKRIARILISSLLLTLFFLLTPAANAQLPVTNNGWEITAYQVNSVPAPPAWYFPSAANNLEVFIAHPGPSTVTQVRIVVMVDFDQNGSYSLPEVVFTTVTTIPPGGSASLPSTSQVFPTGLPGNTNTYIGVFDHNAGFSVSNLSNALVSTNLKGGLASGLVLSAVVDDEPNFVIPSCPYNQISSYNFAGNSLEVVNGQRDLLVDVYNPNNPGAISSFTIKRTIFYTTDANAIPKPFPTNYAVSPSVYIQNSASAPLPFYHDPLQFIYYPSAPISNEQATTFEIYYHLEDDNGNPIEINNYNSTLGAAHNPILSFRSHDIEICDPNISNEGLNSEVLTMLEHNSLVLDGERGAGGEGRFNSGGGRGRLGPQNLIADETVLFPNPSEGTTFMQLSLEQATELSWKIRNLKGQTVINQQLSSVKSGLYTIDLGTQNLAAGLYLCEYELNGQTHFQRFVKQ
ncbi:MAG: T9SS type A sorting domain-containing protein [Bacteroidota bacterium]